MSEYTNKFTITCADVGRIIFMDQKHDGSIVHVTEVVMTLADLDDLAKIIQSLRKQTQNG